MNKEDVVYIHNGILFSHKKEWNLAIFNDVDEAKVYNAKWNKSVRKRQIPYDFTHMCNLRNKTKKQRVKKRVNPRNRLNYREQTDGYQREVGGGMCEIGDEGKECICCDEHGCCTEVLNR